jgi:hypothetical protein
LSEQRPVSRTLTLLLVFVITVVAIVIIFAYFTNVLHFFGPASKDVSINKVMTITGAGGPTATLAFSVTNLSTTSLVGATFGCPSQFSDPACGSLALQLNGAPISAQNSVSKDVTAGGTATVTAAPGGTFTAGEVFTINVTLSFSDGTSQTFVEQVAAQA